MTTRFSRRTVETGWCYLFMRPSLVLAARFTFYPIVASWYFSMLDWSGFSPHRTFVGLDNYIELVGDSYFCARVLIGCVARPRALAEKE